VCRVALFFLLASLPASLPAEEVAEQDVRAAVETWLRFLGPEPRPDAVVDRMEPFVVDGETRAYIAHLSGRGFCIAGNDDHVIPVTFCSTGGTYDPGNPGYRFFLRLTAAHVQWMRQAIQQRDPALMPYGAELGDRELYWQDLIARRVPSKNERWVDREGPDRMVLPLTTRWDQHEPYNLLCPLGYNGSRTVVGCVATAAVQIMKYWEWPPNGTGTHSYGWNGDDSCEDTTVGGGTQSASYSDTYDWGNMPDSCVLGCTQVETDALAELSYEAAVSADMDFGACGSSSSLGNMEPGLEDHFRYDSDGDNMSWPGEFIDEMTQEIRHLRPVEMRGQQGISEDGHAWVVYGYNKSNDPNRLFLINLGWGGQDSSYAQWHAYDHMPYPDYMGCLRRIAPESAVRFVGGPGDDNDGTPDSPYQSVSTAVQNTPDHSTLIFRAGDVFTFSSATLTIDRPMVLKGFDVTIRKQ
jgi:hypothetical protein